MRLRVDMLVRGLREGSLEVVSAEFTDTTGNYTLFDHVRIEDAVLLEVVRNRVLCEERRLQADLGANPLTFGMELIRNMLARTAGSKLRTEGGALNLAELLKVRPSCVAPRTRDINFESDDRHKILQTPALRQRATQ